MSPTIILAVGQCMAHGIGPITFDSWDLALAFLRTLSGDAPVGALIELVQTLAGPEAAKTMGTVVQACLGLPV